MHEWVGELIETELGRLARRCPELSGDDLADIGEVIWRVAAQIYLDPLEQCATVASAARRLFEPLEPSSTPARAAPARSTRPAR